MNGDIYEGNIKNGKIEGRKMIYNNGDIYEGEFIDNKYNGNGTYYWKNGNNKKGIWENGKLIKWVIWK